MLNKCVIFRRHNFVIIRELVYSRLMWIFRAHNYFKSENTSRKLHNAKSVIKWKLLSQNDIVFLILVIFLSYSQTIVKSNFVLFNCRNLRVSCYFKRGKLIRTIRMHRVQTRQTIDNRIPMRQLHTRLAIPSFATDRRSFQSQRVESFAPTSKEKVKSPNKRNWQEGRSGPKTPRKKRRCGSRWGYLETFLFQLVSRVPCISPFFFFNPCNKSRIKDAEVSRSFTGSRD